MTFELSANADTFIRCADFAAMRSVLSLTAFSTLIPGTGVLSALGMPANTVGGFVVFGSSFGTPSSITLTNGTGLPLSGLAGLGAGVAAALAIAANATGGFSTANPALKANLAGDNTFTGKITIENNSSPSLNIRRLTTGSSTTVGLQVTAVTSIDATDGFGPVITFRIEDTGVSDNAIGALGFLRAGHDGTGDFVVRCQSVNIAAEKFRLKSTGQALFFGPATLETYTVAAVPNVATNVRGMIYVSDESGGATVAYSNGVNWKRVYDNANIS